MGKDTGRVNANLPPKTWEQIESLIDHTRPTVTAVIIAAVDQMHNGGDTAVFIDSTFDGTLFTPHVEKSND